MRLGNEPWRCTTTSSAPCSSVWVAARSRRQGIRFSSCSTAPSARSAADWAWSKRWQQVRIRVGIHSGEVELTAEHVNGVAVHVAARVLGEAQPGEVLVSSTTRDLAEGAAGLAFKPQGRHRLKGLERAYELFAATSSTG